MSTCFIAHRGYSGKYQENTDEAFLEAVKHGSGGIETDVRTTADGVLVVNHNSTAVFADGTELEIASSTYEQLLHRYEDLALHVPPVPGNLPRRKYGLLHRVQGILHGRNDP